MSCSEARAEDVRPRREGGERERERCEDDSGVMDCGSLRAPNSKASIKRCWCAPSLSEGTRLTSKDMQSDDAESTLTDILGLVLFLVWS